MSAEVTSKIEAFFANYRLRHYAKGQVLILSGDEAQHVYYLVSGKVKQYDVTYRGDEIILNIFRPPAFFPMSLAINGGPSPYLYEAETDIEIRQAPANEVLVFVKDNPDVLFDLMSRVYRGIDALLDRTAHLMKSSAKSRLMFELLTECRRFGGKSGAKACVIKINEKELGARAGLSRETVSRELNKLVRSKLVSHETGGIIIHDVGSFEQELSKVN